ncbi:hypothetical protein PN36_15930 [Candidatus Thiomargarita nelsonii]|uniref:Uncharacterized protein n=1 Tax=Candidatus Thiomargarita nelsonii TaxID=1003181 RepID=A0A0A6PH51_9GAMM|nr:hypothetical protein PN36_15930 [Candidatus Thiomargarita nelsonii]
MCKVRLALLKIILLLWRSFGNPCIVIQKSFFLCKIWAKIYLNKYNRKRLTFETQFIKILNFEKQAGEKLRR